jgi:exoribonuclease R
MLQISNRDYTEWRFANAIEAKAIEQICPLAEKLFHGDQIDASGKLVLSSPYRKKENICGVLLTSEKTYGRCTSGKLLYKCVPDAEHLPCFLIPYEEKQIGFNKTRNDRYIAFRLKEWTDKHPRGMLTNTFGEVNDTEAYIAYQLACQDLNVSLKTLNAATLRALRETTLGPIPLYCNGIKIEDRRALPIISIDPAGCKDIDDALGLQIISDEESILSIYIAHVPMMLEYLNLWPHLTERSSTIYLPEKKMPMLPFALSENVCSLHQKEDRVAFVLDITIKHLKVQRIHYTSAVIRVEKNYAYDAAELIQRADYKGMLDACRQLNDTFQYMPCIKNSHELVEYCMLFMNRECAKILQEKNTGGIFRATHDEPMLDNELQQLWQNVAGEYCSKAKPHALIGGGLDSYLHITSPIRRLVDIVNILEILQDQVPWSSAAHAFKEKWQASESLARINRDTKATRKLQNEIEVLQAYEKEPDRIYAGIVFNQTKNNENSKGSLYKYKAYLKETKVLTTVLSTKNIPNNTTVYFSAHLFLDEAKMTKKVRLQLIT